MVDLDRVIFIVGVGRSGTTLLQCMLNAHSEVCFLPETHFLRHFPGDPGVATRILRKGMGAIRDRLAADPDILRVGPDILAQALERNSDSLSGFYRALLSRYAEKRCVRRVGEKDPKNIELLPLIKNWFPEARIIHVVRDPRDIVVSRARAQWSRGRPFLVHLAACREQLHLGCTEGPALFGPQYRELRYEDLIRGPENVLSELCEWLGLKYEPGMLAFQKSAAELIKGKEKAWKKECSGPLLPKNSGKFSRAISRRRIRWTEVVCREAFQRFGYPAFRSQQDESLWDRLENSMLSRLFRGVDRFYSLHHKRKMKGALIENQDQR